MENSFQVFFSIVCGPGFHGVLRSSVHTEVTRTPVLWVISIREEYLLDTYKEKMTEREIVKPC